MRMLLLSSFLIVGLIAASAQAPGTPAKPPQGTGQPKPAPGAPAPAPPSTTPPATTPPATTPPATTTPPAATPAPARRAAPATNSRSGMAITVTDPKGVTLSGIRVSVSGATARSGETDDSGNVNFPGMMAGTYRLRFDGDKVIS